MWTIQRTIDLALPERMPPRAEPIPLMYPGDASGHTIRLTVLDGGSAATLSGTPYGFFTRSDGQTVIVEGTLVGNVISVTLGYDCYAVRGALRAVVRLGNPVEDPGDPCASLLELTFHVRDGFGETYTPSGVFPTLEGLVNGGIVDIVYPVGSIYMSASGTSPATLFPGTTWTQLQDTFLLAAGSTYAAGSTGGEAEHTLTTNEMPSHRHEGLEYSDSGRNVGFDNGSYNDAYKLSWATPASRTATIFTVYAGGGQAHNNMPPYLAVYMWQRTA